MILATAGLTVLLVALGTFIHYEVLRHCNERLPRLDWVAGMEALTGLLMISWSASFTYLEMSRNWLVPDR